MICLPSIVDLHKLTGIGQHAGKLYEQCNCFGGCCEGVCAIVGGK